MGEQTSNVKREGFLQIGRVWINVRIPAGIGDIKADTPCRIFIPPCLTLRMVGKNDGATWTIKMIVIEVRQQILCEREHYAAVLWTRGETRSTLISNLTALTRSQ